MKGTVKWYNMKKGYGFVKGEDDQEYFVHYTALPQGVFLRENDTVSFEPADTEKGKQAQKVELLEKASEKENGGEGGAAPQEGKADQGAEEQPADQPAEEAEAPAEDAPKDSENF